MKHNWRVPDHRLESIAAGTEDYDGEDVSCVSAELWNLRGEIGAKDAIILGLKEAANQLRAERDALRGLLVKANDCLKSVHTFNTLSPEIDAALAAQEKP